MGASQNTAVPSRRNTLVGLHHHGDQQIAGGAAVLAGVALSPQGDGLAVVDAGGNGDLDGLAFAHVRRCPWQSGQGWWMMLAACRRTCGQGRLVANTPMGVCRRVCTVPLPWQSGQISGVVPGGAAAALAGRRTARMRSTVTLLFAAEGRLLEADGHAGADALAPLGGVGVPPLLAAEAAAEEAAEDVAQIAEVEAARAAECAACPPRPPP